MAGIPAQGSDVRVTASPTSNGETVAGFVPVGSPAATASAAASASMTGVSMLTTSSSERATGVRPLPTNPVTPLVDCTTRQESSVSSMRMSTYPGMRTRETSLRWPRRISKTSSIGTSIWKM